ncbi:antitermination protein NusG [Exilibacterium tricleocarpae]|uniref:Antitermination protein NusG n=1 Tax=Exilibacterium tricleocarpae TaxID=2591008 RepID=A0A545TQI3_9GAMM|nr:urate hydroxylase PuuD [Exilibacterium tricleocarpae]TQV79485.1 antitermination protein NusG [Exilibacterium tricleocarpae]
MEIRDLIVFLFRWAHLLFGIAWIGLLYYFNFVQGGYFKKASPEALSDAKAKLAPSALWWFRWGAMMTFLTGVVLLVGLQHGSLINDYIVIGVVLGILMFLNVWLVIWPNQKIALGLVEGGDGPQAAAKALLASRTNTLFSAPMAYCMLASPHLGYQGDHLLVANGGGTGMWVALALVAALEVNALAGKQGPMTTVQGVIVSSLVLTAVLVGLLVAL